MRHGSCDLKECSDETLTIFWQRSMCFDDLIALWAEAILPTVTLPVAHTKLIILSADKYVAAVQSKLVGLTKLRNQQRGKDSKYIGEGGGVLIDHRTYLY